MSRTPKAADFLAKMQPVSPEPTIGAVNDPPVHPTGRQARSSGALKHIGAYLEPDAVEKVALLRVRLRLDNSQLIKRAIDQLWAAEAAKAKFGDA